MAVRTPPIIRVPPIVPLSPPAPPVPSGPTITPGSIPAGWNTAGFLRLPLGSTAFLPKTKSSPALYWYDAFHMIYVGPLPSNLECYVRLVPAAQTSAAIKINIGGKSVPTSVLSLQGTLVMYNGRAVASVATNGAVSAIPGGNIIGQNGGNVIASGTPNTVMPFPGNLVSPSGARFVPPASGSLMPATGANLAAASVGNFAAAGTWALYWTGRG